MVRAEDEVLFCGVVAGNIWPTIANSLENRSSAACKDRWTNYLKSKKDPTNKYPDWRLS